MDGPISLKMFSGNRTLKKAGTCVAQSQNQAVSVTLNSKNSKNLEKNRAPLNPKSAIASVKPNTSRNDHPLQAYSPITHFEERGKKSQRSDSQHINSKTERTPSREILIRQERGTDGKVKFILKQPSSEEKNPQECFTVRSRLNRLPSLGDVGRAKNNNGDGLPSLTRLSTKENISTQQNNLELAACAFLAWAKEEKREKEKSLSTKKMEDMAQKRRNSERKNTKTKNEPGWYISALSKKEPDPTTEKTTDGDDSVRADLLFLKPTETDENKKNYDEYWMNVLKNNGGSWLFPLMNKDKNKKKIEELELQKAELEPINFCGKRLMERRTFDVSDTKVLSVRNDNEDEKLAVGCEDGITRIYIPEQNKLHLCLSEPSHFNIPISCLRWHPMTVDSILLTCRTNGKLTLWNVRLNKIMADIEEKSQTYAVEFSKDGGHFASGGSDCLIRIYDESKLKVCQSLSKGGKHPGHSNRIYALKFEPTNPNILYSGGWDEVVFAWDLRVGHSVNYIYGPLICGDSLDVCDMQILTGSWRVNNQLEIWDVRKMKLLRTFPWNVIGTSEERAYIYSCQFSKINSNLFAAGSSGTYEIRIFDQLNSATHVDACSEFQKGIFSIDFRHRNNTFSYGCGAGRTGIMEII